MSLRDIKLKESYSSDEDDIVNDFLIPCLSQSKKYYRIAGYFSSTSLSVAARGVIELIKHDGEMRILASPILTDDDIRMIKEININPEKYIVEGLIKEINYNRLQNDFEKKHLMALGWMLANKKLKIKLVLGYIGNRLLNSDEFINKVVFHQKIGIMEDNYNHRISFSGSINETGTGWLSNIEEFKVFKNWESEIEKYVDSDYKKFNNYWYERKPQIKIITLPIEIENRMISLAPDNISDVKIKYNYKNNSIKSNIIEPRDYQLQAIESWKNNNYSGIFKMATGTGKTFTAIMCINELIKNNNKLGVIIVCPYIHLINQWKESLIQFNYEVFEAFEYYKNWEKDLNKMIVNFKLNIINNYIVITTQATFSTKRFKESINKIELDENYLLIIDEVHHISSNIDSDKLPKNIKYRLGLSATPEDWYDSSNNLLINKYFINGIIFEYNLERAIKENWLTPYYYYPILIQLTDDEMDKYMDITKKIINIIDKDDKRYEEMKKQLLFKRSRIIQNAKNKNRALLELIDTSSNYNLIYIGDKIENSIKNIDNIVFELGKNKLMKVVKFTANENKEERNQILNSFSKGEIQAIVAIRCLDEGVDIPETKNAYILASTTNPRQFIQRRGRILRKSKNKDHSNIYDFICLPSNISTNNNKVFKYEQKLVKRELQRVNWFAELALNSYAAKGKLLIIKKYYGLLHM